VCRVTPRLAGELAEAAQGWRPLVGTVAENLALLLDGRSSARPHLPTPLSGRNRSAGRGTPTRPATSPGFTPRRSCIHCGRPVRSGRVTCGDVCEAATRSIGLEAFVAAGRLALAKRREGGQGVEISEAGRERLRKRTSALVHEARDWQRGHAWPSDFSRFEREILPQLDSVSVRDLVRATGLSDAYCRRIKRGQAVPHPMWWEALSSLGVRAPEPQEP